MFIALPRLVSTKTSAFQRFCCEVTCSLRSVEKVLPLSSAVRIKAIERERVIVFSCVERVQGTPPENSLTRGQNEAKHGLSPSNRSHTSPSRQGKPIARKLPPNKRDTLGSNLRDKRAAETALE